MAVITTEFVSDRALKTYVFYCANHSDGDPLVMGYRGRPGDTVKTISLPCSGKVDVPYLVKAFETGADGIVILTCKESECRHLEGTPRTYKRAEAVDALLDEIGMGAGRIAVIEWDEDGGEKVLGKIQAFFDSVRNLPELSAQRDFVNQKESTAE
jgi:F420-non-reducing hydrogenase iron-sulfur subunit